MKKYKRHELQDSYPEAYASALFWSRLLEATGEQSELTECQSLKILQAYCDSIPFFEDNEMKRRQMIRCFNSYLTYPVSEEIIAEVESAGRKFYEKEKPSTERLMEVVAQSTGFELGILKQYTVNYLIGALSLTDEREKLEALFTRMGFEPLYKD